MLNIKQWWDNIDRWWLSVLKSVIAS